MRVIQLLPTLSFGDAIGNDTLALKEAIARMGFRSEVYAENIDKRLPADSAKNVDKLKNLAADDVILYHKSTGTDLTFRFSEMKCRKIMIYHNITPAEFFRPYSNSAAALSEYGYEGVKFLSDKVDYCMAVSSYNREDLLKMGYKCLIDVRPILIRFDDYKQSPDEMTVKKYSDGKTNLVFVGRISPNKKQEDVIRAFYCYKRLNPNSRLILVGSYSGMENYFERLRKYAAALGLEDDVIFTGHIKFSEILAYYRLADVFVCMSAHEGFCVPVVEAMFFDVPVIALASSALPDTMGGSGILLPDSDPAFAAGVIDRVVRDKALRSHIIEGQRSRLEDFSYEKIMGVFEDQLRGFIDKKKGIK